jgi:hypothetical protein
MDARFIGISGRRCDGVVNLAHDVSSRIAVRRIVIFGDACGKAGLVPAERQSQFGLTHGLPSAAPNGRERCRGMNF